MGEGGEALAALAPRYQGAFPLGYADTFSPARAIQDIERIERLAPERPVAIDFHADTGGAGRRVRGLRPTLTPYSISSG